MPIEYIDNTNWGLIVTTLVLAGITGYYAIQTRKTVKAIEESTKATFRPYLNSSIFLDNAIIPLLRITNIGKGAAQNIVINFSVIERDGSGRESFTHVLAPNGFIDFPIPVGENQEEMQFEFFRDNQITITGEWNCIDIFGEPFHDAINIDVTTHIIRLGRTATLFRDG